MKLKRLVWQMKHSCHYLSEMPRILLYGITVKLLCDELPIVFVHKGTLISLNHVHQYKYRQLTFCVSDSCLYKSKHSLCCSGQQ